MTEVELLRAVIETPDDDGPRLRYAAWLSGHGDPRGEFIALQCKLEALSADAPGRAALDGRASELETAHREAWAAAAGIAPGSYHLQFRRGLLCAGEGDMTGDPLAVLDRAPLAHLFLGYAPRHDYQAAAARIAGDPRLQRLRSLALGGAFGERAFATLMSGPHWAALRGLAITDFRAYAARAIAGSSLARLEKLLIHRGPDVEPEQKDEAAALIAAAANLAALRELALETCDRGVQSIASSPHLTQLRHLVLHAPDNHRMQFEPDDGVPSRNRLGPAAASALAAWRGGGAALVRLGLGGHAIGDAGLAALAQSIGFAALQTLDVRDNGITDAGLIALARGAGMPELTTLCLERNAITAAGIAALASSPRLARIADLSLVDCPIGDAGAVALAQSPYATGLRNLVAAGCGIGDAGVRAIASSPGLAALANMKPTWSGLDRATVAMLRARFDAGSGDRAERRFAHALHVTARVGCLPD